MGWIIFIILFFCLCGSIAAWLITQSAVRALSERKTPAVLFGVQSLPDCAEAPDGRLPEPERVQLRSPYGYTLFGEVYACEDSDKGVVLCHGAGASKEALRPYVQMFLERSVTVLLFDQRGHGESGKSPCSFGHFERYDARECVNFLRERLGVDSRVGVWGMGMGAAAAADLLKEDGCLAFAILDSVYTDLKPVFEGWLQRKLGKLPLAVPARAAADLVLRFRYGWRLADVQPLWGMQKTTAPLLLIHGAADQQVKAEHAYRFVLARPDAQLVIFPKAAHGGCRTSNPAEYRRTVQQFLIRADF